MPSLNFRPIFAFNRPFHFCFFWRESHRHSNWNNFVPLVYYNWNKQILIDSFYGVCTVCLSVCLLMYEYYVKRGIRMGPFMLGYVTFWPHWTPWFHLKPEKQMHRVCSCDRQCTRALDDCKCKYIIIIITVVSSERHRVSRKFAVRHNVLNDFALIFFSYTSTIFQLGIA